jgi:hypothetical protein
MTYNYFNLLQEFTITIPMIQRDYAQGRKTAGDIRTNFLCSLKEVLLSDGSNEKPDCVHLDFIYGSTTAGRFIPLDGQQRLTTLHLIHWYIAAKEGIISTIPGDERSENLKAILSRFTYETRISSERFCEELAMNPLVVCAEESLGDAITDSSWFVAAWASDPTVQSMLTMLEAIHHYFHLATPVWDKLVDANTITFEFIDIKSEKFKLTDELYIKMNSRGKALSKFETFKAQFTDLLSNKDFDGHTMPYENSNITYRQYFEIKMDGDWMNLFWNSRYIIGIDDGIINFLTVIAEMLYYTDHDSKSKYLFGEALKTVYSKRKNALFLFQVLDILAKCEDVPGFFQQFFYAEGSEPSARLKLFDTLSTNLFLKSIRDDKLEVRNRILFYALFYHLNHVPKSSRAELVDFLRIIRNLTLRIRQVDGQRIQYQSNLRINDFDSYHLFIHELTEAIVEAPDTPVYVLLGQKKWKGFGETYLVPEQQKAIHILKSAEAREAIHQLEDHNLLQGITDLIDIGSDRIPAITNAFYELWNGQFNASQLIRGLLTHGDYAIATHKWSNLGTIWYFGTDGFWNRILTAIGEKKERQEENKAIYTGFLLDFASRRGTFQERLYQIIDEYESTDRGYLYYFIKYPAMTSSFNNKTLNLFAWDEDGDFDIHNVGSASVQPLSAYHVNPYVATLSKSVADPSKCKFYYGRFTDDLSCVEVDKKIQIYSKNPGWYILPLNGVKLKEEIVQKYKLTNYSNGYLLKDDEIKDRIQIATDFVKDYIAY